MNNKIIHIIIPTIAILFFMAILGYNFISGDFITHSLLNNGIVTGWGIPQIANTTVGILLNGIVLFLIAILITIIASHFKMLKEKTLLPLFFFTVFQLLTPQLIGSFNSIHITTLITFVLIALLYTCYQNNKATEMGFLIALILSTTSLIDAHIIYLLPILVIGLIQMQASSLRTYAAMLIGLITPYWITWGLGLIELSQIDMGVLAITPQIPQLHLQLLPVIVVILIGFITGIGNLYSALNEKIHTRATNGFINLLSSYTAILLIVDNANYMQYIPLLNACVALQASYFFNTLTKRTTVISFYTLSILLIGWVSWIYWGNYPF